MTSSPSGLTRSWLAVALLVAIGGGCGRSSSDHTASTPPPGASIPETTATLPGTSSSTTTSVPADGDGGIDTMDGAGTSPQSGTATGSGIALLDSVRVARHEGFDRVVFEFRNHVPGYLVQYVDKPVLSDGAGEPVPVDGNDALGVRMDPSSGVDLTGTGPNGYEEVYSGPKRINGGTPEITEVVQSGDFEAVLNWVIGTRERVDFRVIALTSPARLVVDLRNH
jgi:hypothetical protein